MLLTTYGGGLLGLRLRLGLFLVPLDGVFGVLRDVSPLPRVDGKVVHLLPLLDPFLPDDFDGVVHSGVGVFLEKRNVWFWVISFVVSCIMVS